MTDAQKRALINYQHRHYVSFSFRMKPEEKEMIMKAAEKSGMSVRLWMLEKAEEDLKR